MIEIKIYDEDGISIDRDDLDLNKKEDFINIIKDDTYQVYFNGETDFESYVAIWMRQQTEEEPHNIFDVIDHGCESGTVSELVYSDDCLNLFNQYHTQILEILDEIQAMYGARVSETCSSVDKMVWTAFEHTVYTAISGLGLEDA